MRDIKQSSLKVRNKSLIKLWEQTGINNFETRRGEYKTEQKKKETIILKDWFSNLLLRRRKMRFENWNRILKKKLWNKQGRIYFDSFLFPFIHFKCRFTITVTKPMTNRGYDLWNQYKHLNHRYHTNLERQDMYIMAFSAQPLFTILDDNKVLRIFGSKRNGVKRGRRKLHNEDFHNLYSSPSVIVMM